MADTVNVQTVFDGSRRQVVHLTGVSDGTGESAVQKVDISSKTYGGATATYSTIDKIEYAISDGYTVQLDWDHTTDDEIAVLSGQGCIDWTSVGGKTDPKSAGGTGDIVLTASGMNGDSYDITIHDRPKA